jgi:hypothetical protein
MTIETKIFIKQRKTIFNNTHKKIIYHDQVGSTSGIQGCFNICESINVLHPIGRINENHMIISIVTEKLLMKFNIPS